MAIPGKTVKIGTKVREKGDLGQNGQICPETVKTGQNRRKQGKSRAPRCQKQRFSEKTRKK